MMLYKITKVKVRSPDGETYFVDIVAGVLHINPITVHNLLRLRTPNIDRSNERKSLYTKNKRQGADDTTHKLLRTQTTQKT